MADEKDNATKGSAGLYFYAVSTYLVVMGLLYLWGYWGPFRINILEYLGLSDMVKPAALPLAPALAPFLGGLLLAHVSNSTASSQRPLFPPGGGVNTALGQFLNKYSRALATTYLVGVAVLVTMGVARYWQGLPYLIALPAAVFLDRYTTLFGKVDPHARFIVLLTMSVALPMAFGQGRLKAQDILSGERYEAVLSKVEGYEVAASAEPSERLRFLGYAGEHLFFFDPISRSVAMEREDNKKPPIRLQSYVEFSKPALAAHTPAIAASAPAKAPSNEASGAAIAARAASSAIGSASAASMSTGPTAKRASQ